ncbi:DUF4394 domain-containing protein [Micromonospora sp. NPDC051141]|uniref:DUF4394 domain-containing protein n=1 Tax=Micromonospora sp. NPDC051141 TaxID=3364284 RepID=UPI0037A7330B
MSRAPPTPTTTSIPPLRPPLFDIDTTLDQVALQSPANSGQLAATGALGVNANFQAGFDIHSPLRGDRAVANNAYAVLNSTAGSRVYRVDPPHRRGSDNWHLQRARCRRSRSAPAAVTPLHEAALAAGVVAGQGEPDPPDSVSRPRRRATPFTHSPAAASSTWTSTGLAGRPLRQSRRKLACARRCRGSIAPHWLSHAIQDRP